MVTVLKLGGSVVTEKDSPETVDTDALADAAAAVGTALASEVPASPDRLVVVHGAGSFGHYHADRHAVSTEAGTHDATAVTDIHGSMTALNRAVVDALQAEGVGAVPVQPLSAAARAADGSLSLAPTAVATLLDEGFTPVLHGDVIGHAGAGATILSGDEVVVDLAHHLDTDRVGLCSTVPGVFDDDGDVIPRIDRFEDVADALGGSDATDVTGGMAGKVRALLDIPVPAQVFGPAALADFLAGQAPGTTVGGSD